MLYLQEINDLCYKTQNNTRNSDNFVYNITSYDNVILKNINLNCDLEQEFMNLLDINLNKNWKGLNYYFTEM